MSRNNWATAKEEGQEEIKAYQTGEKRRIKSEKKMQVQNGQKITMIRLLCVLIFTCVSANDNYIFSGCEIKEYNMLTEENSVDIWVARFLSTPAGTLFTSPMRVRVTTDLRDFEDIVVPVPHWKWSHIVVNMKDKLHVVGPNNSIFPADGQRESIVKNFNSQKRIKILNAVAMANCPQGLPYSSRGGFFPSLSEERADQIYLIYPAVNMTAKLLICRPLSCHTTPWQKLCWNKDSRQLEMNLNRSKCSRLPELQYHWLRLHFENEQVKVMNENGVELASLSTVDEYRVRISTESRGDLYVVQCLERDCLPLGSGVCGTQCMIYISISLLIIIIAVIIGATFKVIAKTGPTAFANPDYQTGSMDLSDENIALDSKYAS